MNTPQQFHSPGEGPGTGRARPVEEIRLGTIRAAIWRNETESGVRHNVTFERIYRDGDQWRSTKSFGPLHLLLLAKVSDQAHTWIHQQGRDTSSSLSESPTSVSGNAMNTDPSQSRPRQSSESSLSKGHLPSMPAGG
jgi:hypothetical protein